MSGLGWSLAAPSSYDSLEISQIHVITYVNIALGEKYCGLWTLFPIVTFYIWSLAPHKATYEELTVRLWFRSQTIMGFIFSFKVGM